MDGRRHEISVRLIAASIPAQALMMAGVAALALGAAAHGRPAPAIQVGPAQLTKPTPAWVYQVQTCWPKQPAAMSPADWKQPAVACAWLPSVPSPSAGEVTIILNTGGPCCGG